MRDRVPTPGRENRVKITQDDGTVVSGVLEYDDQATQEGSPYTRGNVLPDDVCNAYNLDKVTSEPKDAFLAVPGIMGKALLTITVTKINGQPYPGVVVNGLANVDTPRRTTNSEGKVVVYVDAGTYNLTFAPNPVCVDTSIPGKTVTVAAGGVGSVSTKEVSNGLTSLSITSSRTVAFSANAQNIDVFCVGGGGAGGASIPKNHPGLDPAWLSGPSAGGGGGYTTTRKNAALNPYTAYSAVVGSGGTATTSSGGNGGRTSLGNITANGGKAGGTCRGWAGEDDTYVDYDILYKDIRGGNGGSGGGGVAGNAGDGGSNGSDGENGNFSSGVIVDNGGKGQGTTTTAFGENAGIYYGAGGGAGGGNGGAGGETGGGAGSRSSKPGNSGEANTGAGGGGTQATHGNSTPVAGGNGGSGIIKLRWVNAS